MINDDYARRCASSEEPNFFRGALAGLAGGLAASLGMDLAQRALAKLQSSDGGYQGEPSTEQAADRLDQATTGSPVPDTRKAAAGQAVHYAFGAVLDLGYGIAAEYVPTITVGAGSVFGIGSFLSFDEAAVAATGLGQPPWEVPASAHLYGLASHIVFGLTLEATRRVIQSAL